jgi:hypothetical protein
MKQHKKILKEDRWSRLYETDRYPFVYESKFRTDGISISTDQLTKEWGSWSVSERLSFANAFREKLEITAEDETILEFLMANGDDRVRTTIATSLTRHSNKDAVLEFLIQQLECDLEMAANYLQALTILGNPKALPAIRSCHTQMLAKIEEPRGDPDHSLIVSFLSCCATLWKMDGGPAYRDIIRSYLNHADEPIRNFAKACLEKWPL